MKNPKLDRIRRLLHRRAIMAEAFEKGFRETVERRQYELAQICNEQVEGLRARYFRELNREGVRK